MVDDEELARWSVGQGQAVQLVGDCGRGKTTRLLALHRRHAESTYVYIPQEAICPPIPSGSPLLIDEAQRLPRKVGLRIYPLGLPLVLATHNDLGSLLRQFGYTVRTFWIGEQNTPELVCRLLNRRIEASRLKPGPLPSVSLEQAWQLVQRHGSNVRAIEHSLYERFQTQVIRDGQVRLTD